MNKVLIRVYVPQLEKKYDVWITINKNVYTIKLSIKNGINYLNKISLENVYILN